MQDASADRDEIRSRRVNELIADPTAPSALDAAAVSREGHGLTSERLMQLFNQGMNPNMDWSPSIRNRTRPTDAAGAEELGQYAADDVQDVPFEAEANDAQALGNADRIRSLVEGLSRNMQSYDGSAHTPVSLRHVLSAGELRVLLQDERLRRGLFPHLPAELHPESMSEADLQGLLASPQFHQALESLSYALNQGNAAQVLTAVGLDPEDARGENGVMAFLRALQREVEREHEPEDDDRMEE